MESDERLAKLFEKGNSTFSMETIVTKEGPKVLITISRGNDAVGGTFDNVDTGINYCITELNRMSANRLGIKLVKPEEQTSTEILYTANPEE